jgi:type I restriction enzyme R subunit
MKFKHVIRVPKLDPLMLDVKDGDVHTDEHVPTFEGQELIAYRQRVEKVLDEHFKNDPVLARIHAGKAVSDDDLRALADQILRIDPVIDIKQLPIQIHIKGDLHRALRSIIGVDAEAVSAAFSKFTHKHTELTAQQIRFLTMLQTHIGNNGGLEIERLYEAPFTTINAEGIDGVFRGELIDELLDIVARFNLPDVQELTA